MGKDILITPGNALINFSGTSAANVNLEVQSDGRVSFVGISSGAEQLTISDSLSGSVFTVNNTVGAPIIDINFDNTITVPNGASTGYVWTSDSGGIATWQAVAGSSSGSCIDELWVSSISGCSPVTFGTPAVYTQGIALYNNNILLTGTTTGSTGPVIIGITGITCSDTSGTTTIKGSNIYTPSISTKYINPNDEGKVFFGSSSGVTIDGAQERIGIGTAGLTNYKLWVKEVGTHCQGKIESDGGYARLIIDSHSNNDAILQFNEANNKRWSIGTDGITDNFLITSEDIVVGPTAYSANTAFYVNRSNNFVGINTISPTAQLHISGDTRIDGDLNLCEGGGTLSVSSISGCSPISILSPIVMSRPLTITNVVSTNFQMTSGATSGATLVSNMAGNASWVLPINAMIKTVPFTLNASALDQLIDDSTTELTYTVTSAGNYMVQAVINLATFTTNTDMDPFTTYFAKNTTVVADSYISSWQEKKGKRLPTVLTNVYLFESLVPTDVIGVYANNDNIDIDIGNCRMVVEKW